MKIRKRVLSNAPYGPLGSIIAYTILIIFSLVVIIPFIWLFFSSFKTTPEILTGTTIIPHKWIFDNYITAWTQVHLGKAMLNSLFVSSLATLGTIVVSAMASYVLSRYDFKAKSIIIGIIMAGLLVPAQAIFVPTIFVQRMLNLYDNLWGLVVVYMTLNLPIAIFVLKGFMNTIPIVIEEAASIDGCNFIQKFFHVVLPMLIPGLVTIGTITFLTCWSEFLFAFNLTSSASTRTLQIALAFFRGQFLSNYGAQYAGIIISVIPSLILFLFFQEKIMEGMAAGAVKG